MEEEQISAMYSSWRNSKKNINIIVSKLPNENGWIGQCDSEFGFVKYGDTHAQVVDRMRTELSKRGFEVGNLPEVFGII